MMTITTTMRAKTTAPTTPPMMPVIDPGPPGSVTPVSVPGPLVAEATNKVDDYMLSKVFMKDC